VKIRDVMTSAVISVRPDTPYKAMVERLVEADVSGLPVIDASGALVGVVTEADLASKGAYGGHRRRALALMLDVLAAPTWMNKAGGWTAADVMTSDVVVCVPDEDLRAAARRMLERRVKRMPVVDDGVVVGMVSRHDLLKVLTRPDDAIERDIVEVLATDPNRPEDFHVHSEVEGGVATLTGDVRYAWDAPVVVSLVRDVAGVIDVISRLHHREPNPKPVSRLAVGPR
jgi:CBS domain-containing protein